jgi:glutamine synthetase type III
LGEKLDAGPLAQISGFGLQRNWAMARDNQKGLLCVGFQRAMPHDQVELSMKHVFAKWAS